MLPLCEFFFDSLHHIPTRLIHLTTSYQEASFISSYTSTKLNTTKGNDPGARPKEGGSWAAAPQTPQNRNLRNTHFVVTISEVLRDLPFSRNQPMKSADDKYIGILNNKLIKLKTSRLDTVIVSCYM